MNEPLEKIFLDSLDISAIRNLTQAEQAKQLFEQLFENSPESIAENIDKILQIANIIYDERNKRLQNYVDGIDFERLAKNPSFKTEQIDPKELENQQKLFNDAKDSYNDVDPIYLAEILKNNLTFAGVNDKLANTNMANFSQFVLYADELILRRYVEEGVDKSITTIQNAELDPRAMVLLISQIDEVLKNSEASNEKYGPIYDAILVKFDHIFEEADLQKKVADLKKEYLTTTNEEQKKEIALELGEIKTQQELFRIMAIKSPELLAKMVLDKNLNAPNMLKNMGGLEACFFINALAQKNPALALGFLSKVAEQDPECLKNFIKGLGKKALEDIEKAGKDTKTPSQKDRAENANENNAGARGDRGHAFELISAETAWRLVNTEQYRNAGKVDEILKNGGANTNSLVSQMTLAEMMKRDVIPANLKPIIAKLQSEGKVTGDMNINQLSSQLKKLDLKTDDIKKINKNVKAEENKIAKQKQKQNQDSFFKPAEAEKQNNVLAFGAAVVDNSQKEEESKKKRKEEEKQAKENVHDNFHSDTSFKKSYENSAGKLLEANQELAKATMAVLTDAIVVAQALGEDVGESVVKTVATAYNTTVKQGKELINAIEEKFADQGQEQAQSGADVVARKLLNGEGANIEKLVNEAKAEACGPTQAEPDATDHRQSHAEMLADSRGHGVQHGGQMGLQI